MGSICMHLAMLEIFLWPSINCRPSLGLHYAAVKPIKVAYGRGQYLYDEWDEPYLDCINNVTHGRPLPSSLHDRSILAGCVHDSPVDPPHLEQGRLLFTPAWNQFCEPDIAFRFTCH